VVRVIAAPTGTGKTYAAAKHVAATGGTCWLCDRHEDVDAAVAAIEAHGGSVGRVLPLRGSSSGILHCLHPDVVQCWQAKGYDYRVGFCQAKCERRAGEAEACPFLQSIAELKDADIIVATKALARGRDFFSRLGNARRGTVVLDEDPISLLRPPVKITRAELLKYLTALDRAEQLLGQDEQSPEEAAAGILEAQQLRRIANWVWDQISRQPPAAAPEPVEVPGELRSTRAVLRRTRLKRRRGRAALYRVFYRMMRLDPVGMVRNVGRDLLDMTKRAAGRMAFVTADELLLHVHVRVPAKRRVLVLDATAGVELLRVLFAPRPVEVVCQQAAQPAGRLIQFMDFNGPRSYLNQVPAKAVRILDALGDLHADGTIVLISHRSCVDGLAAASRHKDRIRTAYFGALRGRNDLEARPEAPIACHIVIGSPKTTEEDRRTLALAVYGSTVLPFAELKTLRRAVRGPVPHELTPEEENRVWEIRIKGYEDPRMQAVYDHTVTAELTQAADRARLLLHRNATVYLVTNEPCPGLWFAEKCLADDFLDLSARPSRSDFQRAYEIYAEKASELLHRDLAVGNADICRALNRKPAWGKRYWQEFRDKMGDALEGERKVRWKAE
jgi:hypothetical protein